MPLFNSKARSSRQKLLSPATGLPSTIGERASVDYETFRDQQTFGAVQDHRREVYDRQIDEIEATTGVRIRNPYDRFEDDDNPNAFPETARVPATIEVGEARYFEELKNYKDRLPASVFRDAQGINDTVQKERAEQRAEQADVQSRTVDTSVSVAGFAGSAAGALTDPVVAVPAVGAALATGGSSLLATVAIEAGVGVLSEAAVQAEVQTSRQQVGEAADLNEAAMAVLFAAGGAALGGVASKAIPASIRASKNLVTHMKSAVRSGKVANTPKVQAAIRAAEAEVFIKEANPFPSTPKGMEAHLKRLDVATKAVARNEVPDFSKLGPPPTATSRVALEVSPVVREVLPADLVKTATEAAQSLQESVSATQGRGTLERLLEAADDADIDTLLQGAREGLSAPETLVEFLESKSFQRTGKPLSEEQIAKAVKEAEQAGFPVASRDELKEALASPTPVVRVDDVPFVETRTAVEDVSKALDDLGIDPGDIRNAADLRAKVSSSRNAVREAPASRPTKAEPVRVFPEREASPEADAADLEELQAVVAENPDAKVFIEDANGNLREMTMKQLQDEVNELDDVGAALTSCLRS